MSSAPSGTGMPYGHIPDSGSHSSESPPGLDHGFQTDRHGDGDDSAPYSAQFKEIRKVRKLALDCTTEKQGKN